MNIVMLSAYPLKNPLHGGQIRSFKIREFLSSFADVYHFSVSHKAHKEFEENDFVVGDDVLFEYTQNPLCFDLAISEFSKSDKFLNFLKKRLPKKIDYIFLEQPWLYPAVEKLGIDANIIYSSQNVEYLTKENILKAHNITDTDCVSRIKELEKKVIKKSLYTITVSKEDKKCFENLAKGNYIVAPNGAEPIKADEYILNDIKKKYKNKKLLFFVGSDYPPNAIGFWEMLGNLAHLRPDEIILVGGRVGNIIYDYMPKEYVNCEKLISSRMKILRTLSKKELHSFIAASEVILLPITSGGGSNLKTAEALVSKKKTVATFFALRGYDVKNLPFVFGSKSKEEFVLNIKRALLTPYKSFKAVDTSGFLWENTLKNIKKIFVF